MIEQSFNDVRRHLEGSQVGQGSPEVVERPVRDAAQLVEGLLVLGPSVEGGRRLAANVSAARRKKELAPLGYLVRRARGSPLVRFMGAGFRGDRSRRSLQMKPKRHGVGRVSPTGGRAERR